MRVTNRKIISRAEAYRSYAEYLREISDQVQSDQHRIRLMQAADDMDQLADGADQSVQCMSI